jgi:type II restriction/modification system DNA methylase subunit YeeA
VPRFTRIARTYLLHAGTLNWRQINPDIFGSMIQAVADDEERGALGMHYTSVPNILKVLNPLFLDESARSARCRWRQQGASCSSCAAAWRASVCSTQPAAAGNFLVIAYKQMREIEAEINKRRGERIWAARFRSPTSAASNCATSRPRSRAWR